MTRTPSLSRAFAPLLLTGWLLAACDDDNDEFFNGGRPDAPINVDSFTGDGEVILVWDSPGGGIESFNVYAFIDETDDFEVIGISTSTAFVDNDVVNGETYRYRVTSVDFDGDESDFSQEAFDTPRPDEYNVLVESLQADPQEAGFDLTSGRVVPADSPAATFRFDEAGGQPRIVPLNGAEVLNVGFVEQLSCRGATDCTQVGFAPESGYFPEATLANVGDAYVFRIPTSGGRFFGVIRVSHTVEGLMVFDWAFQPDEGNRELLRRPRPSRS
ncbi:MAG: hypothetical protein ABR599_04420 [Gemmatimonadota bacterium]